jgi:Ca2+-binding RTX toxin-like protein/lysophospholipase L1-like esterase
MIDRSFVIYGDSRTRSSTSTGDNFTENAGYAGWLEAFSGNEVYLAKGGNYAITGLASQWQTQFSNFVNAESDNAILFVGYNWIAFGSVPLSLAQKKVQIEQMLDQLGDAGKKVFLITELPRSNASGIAEHIALHEWLESPAGPMAGRPWVVPVNGWDALQDPANPNMPNPAFFYDGLHLNAAGNMALGRAIAEAMDPHFVDADTLQLVTSNSDFVSATNPDGVLFSNPMFDGVGGAKGAGITGDVATGWRAALTNGATGMTVTITKSVSEDGFPEQVITFSGTPIGLGASISLGTAIPITNVAPGDVLRGGAMIEVESGVRGVQAVTPWVFTQGASGTVQSVRGLDGTGFNLPTEGFRLPIAAPNLVVQEVPRQAQFQVVIMLTPGVYAEGTVRISQPTVRDISDGVTPPPANDIPVVQADKTVSLSEDASAVALGITAPTDPNADPLTITISQAPALGQLQVSGAGASLGVGAVLTAAQLTALTFRPAADVSGSASFRYSVSDNRGGTASQTVTLAIAPVNDAPVARAVTATGTTSDAQVALALTATDIDSTVQSFTVTSLPTGGTLFRDAALTEMVTIGASVAAIGGAATVFFRPNANGAGTHLFSYAASDGQATSAVQTATLVISQGSTGETPTHVGTNGNDLIIGSAGNDRMVGLGGNDTVNGGAGADTMDGGEGNDTFHVDNTGDVVIDVSGLDTVISTITYALGSSIENLRLGGGDAINGTGNALGNRIDGNSANNLLLGGIGNDVLSGALGNDTLNGGEGDDQFSGGGGLDQFIFDGRDIVGTDTDRVFDVDMTQDMLLLTGFGVDVFRQASGGNSLDVTFGGSTVLINSLADIVELTASSPLVTASRFGSSDVLVLTVRDLDGDVQVLQLWNQWSSYLAAGGA